MTTLRHTTYSVLSFRPDPASEEGALPLGVALEARIGGNSWAVGLKALRSLSEAQQRQLDPIGRELLRWPITFLVRELETLFREAAETNDWPRGGEVLRRVAQKHSWSVHLTEPRRYEVHLRASETTRKAFDRAVDELYRLHVGQGVSLRTPRLAGAARSPDELRLPYPWMIAAEPGTGLLKPQAPHA